MIVYGENFYVLSFPNTHHAATGKKFAYSYKIYFFNGSRAN